MTLPQSWQANGAMVRQESQPREATTTPSNRRNGLTGRLAVVLQFATSASSEHELTPSHVRLRQVFLLIHTAFLWKPRTYTVAASVSILLATETSTAGCLSVHQLLLSSMHPQQELQNLSWTDVRAWLLLLDEENTMPSQLPWSSAPTIESTRPTTP